MRVSHAHLKMCRQNTSPHNYVHECRQPVGKILICVRQLGRIAVMNKAAACVVRETVSIWQNRLTLEFHNQFQISCIIM